MIRSTSTITRTRRIVAATAAAAALTWASAAAAADGPVVFGGDNFTSNGSFDSGMSVNLTGWLAMQRSLEYVAPRVGRFNDNTVAAIGAQASAALMGDAGAGIRSAANTLGMAVTYHNGADAINLFFAQLASGKVRPRVIWIAGSRAANALDASELAAVSANAGGIQSFVAGGGGLIAHGDETVYAGWLGLVAPGLEAYGPAGIGLSLTPAGATTLPGVSPADISVGAWHNAFRGSLGNLAVAAQATGAFEDDGTTPKKVVLVGGTAWTGPAPADLDVATTVAPVVDRGDVVPFDLKVTNKGPNLAGNVTVTHRLPAGWAFGGAATGSGSCTPGPPVTCVLPAIGVGQTAAIRVVGKAFQTGRLTSLTEVSSSVPDPTTADNRSVQATTTRMTRLAVKVVTATGTGAGELTTVRISVRNTGPRVAKRVVVRSVTPPGMSLERRPSGSRIEGNATVWELGGIAPGRTRVVVFRVRVGQASSGRRCFPGHVRAANANLTTSSACTVIRPG